MWSTQRTDLHIDYEAEVSQCAREIIEVGSETVSQHRFEHGFVIFPLFLAGVTTPSATDKMEALELLRALEQESIGNNKRATRTLLQTVYEKQNASQMAVGNSLDVDWIQVMRDSGLQVVNFGL